MKKLFALIIAFAFIFGTALADSTLIKLDSDPPAYIIEYPTGYYGLVSEDGTEIDALFAQYAYTSSGLAYFMTPQGTYRLIDRNNRLSPLELSWISKEVSDNLILATDNEWKYGYIDADTGLWKIEPVFNKAFVFSCGLARFTDNFLYGFINTDGDVVLPAQFEYAYDYNGRYIVTEEKGTVSTITGDGDLISGPADAVVEMNGYGDGFFFLEERSNSFDRGKRGLITYDGHMIMPEYEAVYMLSDNVYAVSNGDKYALLFTSTGETTDFIYDSRPYAYGNDIIKFQHNSLFGLMDITGNYITEPIFDSIWPMYDSVFYKAVLNGHECIIREDRSYAVEPIYDYVGNALQIRPDYAYVPLCTKEGKWIIVDTDGNTITELPGNYNSVDLLNEDYFEFGKGNYYGISDYNGSILLEPEYKSFVYGNDGVLVAERKGSLETTELYYSNGEFRTDFHTVDNSLDLNFYYPYTGFSVAVSDYDDPITWDTDYRLPRLDGATALLPVYGAFAQAVIPFDTVYGYDDMGRDMFACSKTSKAYNRLIYGDTDIIFCAGPSDYHTLLSKLMGSELEFTPIGYEAFVFIVNENSPIDSLTLDELRGIYSGNITSWSELGAPELGTIKAYQRPKNSGSQTALEVMMGDIPIMDALEYEVDSMSCAVETIEFRSTPDAIGFSFRFYCSEMEKSSAKMISVNGIAPTAENVQNGTYPLITPLYAVSLKNNQNPNVRAMLGWLSSDQAQDLVEKSGYINLSR